MSKIYAMYDDDATLLHGAEKLVAKGVYINEVFSPFPIHGIDPVIGIKKNKTSYMRVYLWINGDVLGPNWYVLFYDSGLAHEYWR